MQDSNKGSPNLQNIIFSMDRKKGIGGEYLLGWIGEEMHGPNRRIGRIWERGLRGGVQMAAALFFCNCQWGGWGRRGLARLQISHSAAPSG